MNIFFPQKEISASRKCKIDDTFEPWSTKKVAILNKYTTSEKLSIATSFLSGGEKGTYLLMYIEFSL